MTESALRQNVNDLEEVVRWDAQCADQRVLNCARHLVETSFVVPSFEDMNFGEGHVSFPLLVVTVSSIRMRNPRYRPRIGARPPTMRPERASIAASLRFLRSPGPPRARGRPPR